MFKYVGAADLGNTNTACSFVTRGTVISWISSISSSNISETALHIFETASLIDDLFSIHDLFTCTSFDVSNDFSSESSKLASIDIPISAKNIVTVKRHVI